VGGVLPAGDSQEKLALISKQTSIALRHYDRFFTSAVHQFEVRFLAFVDEPNQRQ
jgi:hypothetical protein